MDEGELFSVLCLTLFLIQRRKRTSYVQRKMIMLKTNKMVEKRLLLRKDYVQIKKEN